MVCVKWEPISPPDGYPILCHVLPTLCPGIFALQGALSPAVLELLAAAGSLSLCFIHFTCYLKQPHHLLFSEPFETALAYALHFGLENSRLRPSHPPWKAARVHSVLACQHSQNLLLILPPRPHFYFLFRFKTFWNLKIASCKFREKPPNNNKKFNNKSDKMKTERERGEGIPQIISLSTWKCLKNAYWETTGIKRPQLCDEKW